MQLGQAQLLTWNESLSLELFTWETSPELQYHNSDLSICYEEPQARFSTKARMMSLFSPQCGVPSLGRSRVVSRIPILRRF